MKSSAGTARGTWSYPTIPPTKPPRRRRTTRKSRLAAGRWRLQNFDEQSTSNISKTIIFYANQSLRTIALCYRDFDTWPPTEALASGPALHGDEKSGEEHHGDAVPFSYLARDLTLIAITGIEDPLRPGVREAVEKCQRAGVGVKMCTGDNVLTARSIANQCGIFTSGGIIMEGPVFRKVSRSSCFHLHSPSRIFSRRSSWRIPNSTPPTVTYDSQHGTQGFGIHGACADCSQLSDYDRFEIVPRLQILARSSPEDKRLLVKTLKSMGEVVGVTGDGTNDGPALKLANVGFAMGIA